VRQKSTPYFGVPLVARKVTDKRVLKLIRAYLGAGVMINGVVHETEEGTPQGGPLSPFRKLIYAEVCLRLSFDELPIRAM